MAKKTFHQGWYEPKHPEKYKGDPTKIRYMSSWELHMHKFLDMSVSVLEWSSEEIAISYYNPLTKKVSKYYPDYYVKYKNKYGKVVQEIVEVKPNNQVHLRKNATRVESAIYARNVAKWKACSAQCVKRGLHFRILTEKQLFSQPKPKTGKRRWKKNKKNIR